jgi:hypothetical protein
VKVDDGRGIAQCERREHASDRRSLEVVWWMSNTQRLASSGVYPYLTMVAAKGAWWLAVRSASAPIHGAEERWKKPMTQWVAFVEHRLYCTAVVVCSSGEYRFLLKTRYVSSVERSARHIIEKWQSAG